MNFKEWLRFVYGMTMGTSVPYLKPTQRFLWPTAEKKLDDRLSLFLGGSCVCGIFANGPQSLLINTNSGAAAKQVYNYCEQDLKTTTTAIISTSVFCDFM